MVDFPVVHRDDGPIGWREDGAPKRVEPFRRFAGQKRAPVTDARGATALIHRHEVNRVALAEQVDSVAWHPPCRAVLRHPGSREGEGEYCGSGGYQAPWNFVSTVISAPANRPEIGHIR